MSLIYRGMLYSELLKDNLGVIYRKEFVDLQNSTIRDFENYTGRKVDSKRSVFLPETDSRILFMHIEEIDNIQNLNLGWFGIEQGDELESDHEFFMLLGRLRRSLTITQKFADTGLPLRSGFIIGNAGDHWGKKIWKESTDPDFPCIEADTYQMRGVIPDDYFKGLEKIKDKRPEIYKKYVLNNWDVVNAEFALIKSESLNRLRDIKLRFEYVRRIISCDPSIGGDECVIDVIENGEIIHQEIMIENDESKIAAKIALLGEDHDVFDFAVDSIGVGHGVATFLNNLVKKHGKVVNFVNSAEKANEDNIYFNKRTEMWFYLSQQILDKKIYYPEDQELRRQLMGVRYEPIMRKGRVRLEEKTKTKSRLKCSPDRADAFVYGIYYLQFVDENRYRPTPRDSYKVEKEKKEELGICNF